MIMNSHSEFGTVVSNIKGAEDIWEMEVLSPNIASDARPGQFVHIRCDSDFNPLLRRPMSIGPVIKDQISLIYAVHGTGTRILTERKAGDQIDLIGPLGSSFTIPDPELTVIFLAGGIGIVPILFLYDTLKDKSAAHFILGVRSRMYMPISEQDVVRRNILISTDDGSLGHHGNVIQLLEQVVKDIDKKKIKIYGCGPTPMLIALKSFCLKYSLSAEISLEVPMGCAIGACQSCAIHRADGKGYYLVCRDGPAFPIEKVDISRA